MELAREFGEVTVDLGFATADEVRDARREQRRILRTERGRVFLAEALLARGLLTTSRLLQVLDRARGYRELADEESPRLGEMAVAKGYSSPAQVYESLVEQRDEVVHGAQRRPLGEIMVEKCRLTPWELEDILVTAAELAAGSLRSGATPAEPFEVGPDLYGGGETYARRYRRDVARTATAKEKTATSEQQQQQQPQQASRTLMRDASARIARTTPDARVGEALDAAIDGDAEAILVFHHEELVGALCPFDARELDPGLPVGRVMKRVDRTFDSQTPLSEAAAFFRETELAFVPIVTGGDVHGAVTPQSLRRAGIKVEQHPPTELGGSD